MTEYDEAAWSVDYVIDLPEVPICIGVGQEQLKDAEVELHHVDGDVITGMLVKLDGTEKLIHLISSASQKI